MHVHLRTALCTGKLQALFSQGCKGSEFQQWSKRKVFDADGPFAGASFVQVPSMYHSFRPLACTHVLSGWCTQLISFCKPSRLRSHSFANSMEFVPSSHRHNAVSFMRLSPDDKFPQQQPQEIVVALLYMRSRRLHTN